MSPDTQLRLLLVEDDPTQRVLLERLLIHAGYSVDTAQSGSEALQMVGMGHYHMMLTDWDMPGMDGITLCHRLRAASLPNYLYILMLTGNSSTEHVVAGLEAGADDYLCKPANEAELLARLTAGRRIVHLEQSLREANAQIQQLSVTDPLTGAYNRRYLNDHVLVEIERAHRHSRPLGLVMTDLDRFKQINDRHGHLVGDDVLRAFVKRLRGIIRPSGDWIARYGGEEFALVLAESDLNASIAAAERIRRECSRQPLDTRAGPLAVTASFGVAALDHSLTASAALEALLREADAALYRSKRSGRNRVTPATQARPRAQAGRRRS
ncbi:MAG TPA: diguanylate cyclase [Steroidobacteraceae bacterium]|nr:diguanylate cyclase [Steroidobacteraceae bacterium]